MIKPMADKTKTSSAPSLSARAVMVLALLSAVAPLSTDMYLPGFPRMTADLETSAAQIQMTLTGFLIGLAAGQLIIGPLSDRYGRRRPLMIGTLVGVVSSLLCALAPNAGTLIALRVIQGLGGAAGVVLARAVIADSSRDAAHSARLFQIMMMIGGIAPVVAPILGTGIVALAGWRGVFALLAVMALISFFGVLRVIDETLPQARRSAGGLKPLVTSIGGLLRNRTYVGYTLTTGFSFMVLFGYISASPFVFQSILGLSPAAYSIAFGLNAIGIVMVGATSAKLVGRISPRRLASVGIGAILIGALCTLGAVLAQASAWVMLPCLFITVASVGMILGNTSALAISEAPRSAGTASALLGALQFCLGAIASPLVGLAGEDSALPMALVMVAAGLLALTCFTLLTRDGVPRPAESEAV